MAQILVYGLIFFSENKGRIHVDQQQPVFEQQPASALQYRMAVLERDVMQLKAQLASYVSIRENDLHLASIRSTVERIEKEVGETKKQIGEMDGRMEEQREAQDKLLIKILWGAVSLIIGVLVSLLIAYLTHLIGS
jgi:chromosome segregation ATPase